MAPGFPDSNARQQWRKAMHADAGRPACAMTAGATVPAGSAPSPTIFNPTGALIRPGRSDHDMRPGRGGHGHPSGNALG